MIKNKRIQPLSRTFFSAALMVVFLVAPSLIATSNNTSTASNYNVNAVVSRATEEAAAVIAEADVMYEDMSLETKGLTKEAFEHAFLGFTRLLNSGLVNKTNLITVADFSQSSRNKRLFIIDVNKREVVMQTYVAHGRGSGNEYATSFSNKHESHKSSLGFYITKGTYSGQHGLSLNLGGLEKGINDNAEARRIVVHGANYIGNSRTGRSHGCPAVESKLSKNIIQTIKDGTVLFIYHPSASYLKMSKILNA